MRQRQGDHQELKASLSYIKPGLKRQNKNTLSYLVLKESICGEEPLQLVRAPSNGWQREPAPNALLDALGFIVILVLVFLLFVLFYLSYRELTINLDSFLKCDIKKKKFQATSQTKCKTFFKMFRRKTLMSL